MDAAAAPGDRFRRPPPTGRAPCYAGPSYPRYPLRRPGTFPELLVFTCIPPSLCYLLRFIPPFASSPTALCPLPHGCWGAPYLAPLAATLRAARWRRAAPMTPLLLACPLSSACGTARRSRTPEEGAKMSGRGKRKSRSARQGCDAKRPQVAPLSSVPGDALAQDVERLYRLRMPPDFYHLWEFCGRRNPQSPQDALREAGLRLVGPYDILAGRHRSAQNREPNYFLHWRYFYDPPELQTVLVVLGESQQHLGYYRDSPDDLPAFIGENEAAKGCQITQMGDNVFAAVLLLLERRRRRRRRREPAGRKHNASLLPLEEELRTAAKALGYSLEQKSKGMKLRAKKVVAPTFHGAGIVVPVDKNDVGYRELPETDAALKRICQSIVDAGDDAERLKAFAPLQEMTTLVQFANDECDYGMGYELGVDLFCFGSHYLYKVVLQLLPLAYSLLKRSLFGEILEAHLSSRSRDTVDQLEQLCS